MKRQAKRLTVEEFWSGPKHPSWSKSARASQLAALADKVYEASEPVHVPGELDYLDDHPQAGGPDTWTDAERNL